MAGLKHCKRAAGLLAAVVSPKAFTEFFVIAVTFVAFVAHVLAPPHVLTFAGFARLAAVSFQAFAEFFTVGVAFVALMANALAMLGVLALVTKTFVPIGLFPGPNALIFGVLTTNFVPINLIDFRDAALNGRSRAQRLERGRRRRRQGEGRQGKGETETHRCNTSHMNAFSNCVMQAMSSPTMGHS